MTHEKRRYSAEDLALMAGMWESAGASQEIISALRQAASTEAQVMGLVEALEAIEIAGDLPLSSKSVAEIATEALSKFRGEVDS